MKKIDKYAFESNYFKKPKYLFFFIFSITKYDKCYFKKLLELNKF